MYYLFESIILKWYKSNKIKIDSIFQKQSQEKDNGLIFTIIYIHTFLIYYV